MDTADDEVTGVSRFSGLSWLNSGTKTVATSEEKENIWFGKYMKISESINVEGRRWGGL